MRPNTIDIDVADENTAGYANDDAAGDGGAITLLVSTPTDGLAHKVVWTPAGGVGVSGNLTLVGTDHDGLTRTETVATNGANAITSVYYYKTLTSATNPTVGANTVDLGWADEVASQTYPIDRMSPYACNIHVDVTGTIDFTVQQAFNSPFGTNGGQDVIWSSITALAAKTADTTSTAAVGATALRIIVNSYSSGAELQMYTSQTMAD